MTTALLALPSLKANELTSSFDPSGISFLTQAQTLADAFASICMMDAPLNVRLTAYASKLRELNFPFAEAYDDLVARLYTGEVGRVAPSVGDPMPPFILPSRSGALVSLDDLMVKGPVVLSFNRGHWCPFCKIELRTISEYHRGDRKSRCSSCFNHAGSAGLYGRSESDDA